MTSMVGKRLIKLGPWNRGINLALKDYSQNLEDSELIRLKNLDPGFTAVRSRTGWKSGGEDQEILTGITSADLRLNFAGTVKNAPNLSGVQGIIIREHDTISGGVQQNWSTFYHTNDGKIFTKFPWTPGYFGADTGGVPGRIYGSYSAVLEYNDDIYFFPGVSQFSHVPYPFTGWKVNSFDFNQSLMSFPPTSFQVSTSSPNGTLKFAFIWKERAWMYNNLGEVYYSKATDLTKWTIPDGGFFKIVTDDAQANLFNAVFIENDTMYIMRESKTYQFNYTSDPADGIIREISSNQGALAHYQLNGQTYIVNADGVFRFSKGAFIDISSQLNLRFMPEYFWKLVFSDNNGMLILSQDRSTQDSRSIAFAQDFDCYAMNLKTGAWTTYQFGEDLHAGKSIGPFTKCLKIFDGTTRRTLYGDGTVGNLNIGSRPTGMSWAQDDAAFNTKKNTCYDKHANGHYFMPEYSLTTKAYDLNDSSSIMRVHEVESLGKRRSTPADSPVIWQAFIDDVAGGTLDASVTTDGINDKLPGTIAYPPFHAKTTSLGMTKAITDIGTGEPTVDDPFLEVYGMTMRVGEKSRNELTETN